MTLPNYESLMRPLLEVVAERGDIALGEVRDLLAARLHLLADDLTERMASGGLLWHSRVHWAKTYLFKAGALDSPRRGRIAPNERTRQLLATGGLIDSDSLRQFPEFRDWMAKVRASSARDPDAGAQQDRAPRSSGSLDPMEAIEQAHREIQQDVLEDLLSRVKAIHPTRFEQLVVRLVQRLGYGGPLGSAEHLGRTGDGGVDGVIREDRLGLDHVYLQAKRQESTVSRPDVQAFVGSLEGFRANKGVFITTSTFSREARDYVGQIQKRIVLIDGHELTALMWETGLGVSVERSYEVKTIDTDFFESDFD